MQEIFVIRIEYTIECNDNFSLQKSVTYHLRNHNGRSVFLEKTPTKGILMCTDENGTNRRFIAYQL